MKLQDNKKATKRSISEDMSDDDRDIDIESDVSFIVDIFRSFLQIQQNFPFRIMTPIIPGNQKTIQIIHRWVKVNIRRCFKS